jgi:type I restriction enzyme, S subunit
MNKLPQYWIMTSFGSICGNGQYGWTTKAKNQGTIKLLRTTDITKGQINWNTVPYCQDIPTDFEKYRVQSNDILISRAGSVGFSALISHVPFPTIFASYLIRFVPSKNIEPRYIAYFLRSSEYWQQISETSSGIALSNVNAKKLLKISTPLAPLNEQKRIADKLDALLAQVDACCDLLDRVPRILDRFRQSVLNAAFSGQLTEGYQINNAGPSDFNNSDASGQLVDFANVIDPNPSHRYPSYFGGTIPLLSTEQMSGLNNWDISSARLTTLDFFEARKLAHNFLDDDIIFARKGRIGLARNPPPDGLYVFSHSVFIIRAKPDKILPSYLLWFLRQEWCVDWLLIEMNSNAGVPTLGKSVMERLPIIVPDYTEQQKIVRYIEQMYAYADHIEACYQNALEQVEQLKPTLLSKAFRGELVPQDPNDEPVAVLLERIRAEQTAQPEKTKRVVSTMIKISRESVKEVIFTLSKDTFSFDDLNGEVSKTLNGKYDLLRNTLFALLDETEPIIKQTFHQESRTMHFIRTHQ